MQRTQPQARKTILEVGHGQKPIWHTLRNLPLADQCYVGMDIGSAHWPVSGCPVYNLELGREEIRSRAQQGFRCSQTIMPDDGTVPMESGSASEAYLSLVLNDPRISELVLERLISEVCRVLEAGGHLVIDNGGISGMAWGDVLVDFRSRMGAFKVSTSDSLAAEDFLNPISRTLNESFIALPHDLYSPFLYERGYPRQFSLRPGRNFAIFSKP